MLPALVTTLLFSISGVSAGRMSRILGGVEANFWRILLATTLLGVWAHTFGKAFAGASLPFFLLSGFLGFGVGDLALYQALPRIGSRLSMLVVHCLAAPLAATVEWLWLGTALTTREMVSVAVILAGVGFALAPNENPHIPRSALWPGIFFGTIAACGQAMGAVLSRKAYGVATNAHETIDGLTAAYQRIWGGVAVAVLSFAILKFHQRGKGMANAGKLRLASKFLIINAFAGPVLGVGFFQWALATTPTGIVLPIVALTPLVIIPFSTRFEGEKPSTRSLIGGAIAVAGVVALRMGSR